MNVSTISEYIRCKTNFESKTKSLKIKRAQFNRLKKSNATGFDENTAKQCYFMHKITVFIKHNDTE